MSKEIDRTDYEFRKRDLQEKYSYAVSRLGTCEKDKKEYWRGKLQEVSNAQSQLKRPK